MNDPFLSDFSKRLKVVNSGDCKNCKNYVVSDSRTNWNGEEPTLIYSCKLRECNYDPKDVMSGQLPYET